MNITEKQKQDIFKKLDAEKERLGSYRRVAKKLKISSTSFFHMCKPERWSEVSENHWQQVAEELRAMNGHDLADETKKRHDWKLCRETNDYQLLTTFLEDARRQSFFAALSQPAGSGKSAILKDFKIDTEVIMYSFSAAGNGRRMSSPGGFVSRWVFA